MIVTLAIMISPIWSCTDLSTDIHLHGHPRLSSPVLMEARRLCFSNRTLWARRMLKNLTLMHAMTARLAVYIQLHHTGFIVSCMYMETEQNTRTH